MFERLLSVSYSKQQLSHNARLWYGIGELLSFCYREAMSCLFAGSFFIILALSTQLPLGSLPRYDFILLAALAIQGLMVISGLETVRELRAICLFHLLGLVLEIFKTHPLIHSWHYPEFAYSKVIGVPLYSGFMYAAVASYLFQAWRLLAVRLSYYPHRYIAVGLASAIYLNFFTHHFIGDYRWELTGLLLVLFWRSRVYFSPNKTEYSMPLPCAFLLIGFFVWLAENIATYFGAWQYPHQINSWQIVQLGKISSWGLLVVISFVVVAEYKYQHTEMVKE